MNLFSFLLGKKVLTKYNDPDADLKSYIKSLSIRTDFVRVEGPFLNEQYALKYLDLYKDLFKNSFYKINATIARQIAIISSDSTFKTRDNSRVDFQINPLNHQFQLFVRSRLNFVVIGVDGELLLNKDDSDRIGAVLKKFPLTYQEFKTQNLL